MPSVLDALSDPRFYGPDVDAVEVVETHISWVFLAGRRAYKVKKPVLMPFLDYRSLAARRDLCFEEVRLNRRLAPDLYLGVRAVVASGNHLALAEPAAPGAVEYLVEMNRFDPGATLAERVCAGTPAKDDLDRVAAAIARFHGDTAAAPDATAFTTQLQDCLGALTVARPLPLVRELAAALTRLCDGRAAELAERERRGLIRDGHGDLRAEHVVLGQRVQIYDCVEFDAGLRGADVGADFAFLVMDLEHLGRRDVSQLLVDAYRAHAGDPGSPALFALFCGYRACVRALVAALRANQLRGRERAAALADADGLIRLAWRYVWRTHLPVVLAVCGSAAVGKTTLAAELADLAGLPHLSSDRTRKGLAGLLPHERGGPEIYSELWNRRVYRWLGRGARAAENGAVVDATFRRRVDRSIFVRTLAPVSPVFVECLAPREVIRARAEARQLDPRRESDADVARSLRQVEDFQPLHDVPPANRICVNTAGPVELVAAAVEAKLARLGHHASEMSATCAPATATRSRGSIRIECM